MIERRFHLLLIFQEAVGLLSYSFYRIQYRPFFNNKFFDEFFTLKPVISMYQLFDERQETRTNFQSNSTTATQKQ